jgi:hypothetical protein
MTHDELEKRIEQFNSLSLPGQPMSMHMGTSYLVSDLWKEILRLRTARAEIFSKAERDDLAQKTADLQEAIEKDGNQIRQIIKK